MTIKAKVGAVNVDRAVIEYAEAKMAADAAARDAKEAQHRLLQVLGAAKLAQHSVVHDGDEFTATVVQSSSLKVEDDEAMIKAASRLYGPGVARRITKRTVDLAKVEAEVAQGTVDTDFVGKWVTEAHRAPYIKFTVRKEGK